LGTILGRIDGSDLAGSSKLGRNADLSRRQTLLEFRPRDDPRSKGAGWSHPVGQGGSAGRPRRIEEINFSSSLQTGPTWNIGAVNSFTTFPDLQD